MRTAWCNILPHSMHFLSCDVFNVIFEKTSITHSFFMLKTKLKLKLSRTFARPNSIPISAYFCPEIDKKRLRCVIMVTKILTCYFSVINIYSKVDFLLIIYVLFARHNRVHDCRCVCEFYEKIIFSDSFRARILTFYI